MAKLDPSRISGHVFEETEFEYTERDVALYALGVGAGGANPCDALELPYVYDSPFEASSFKVKLSN
eukprot:jgi/Mesen1/993/ME000120S00146